MNREQKLEAALWRARVYVEDAVTDDGGIDECDTEFRADLEAIDAALSAPKAEAVCKDCGRHVLTKNHPATGWLAACGKRLTRPEECGKEPRCISDAHGELTRPISPIPAITDEAVERAAKALESLQEWLFRQRVDLRPNDPEFFVKHDLLKSVGTKIREMRAAFPSKGEGE